MKKLLLIEVPEGRELIVMTRKGEGYISIMQDYKEITFPKDEDVSKEIDIRFTDEYTRQEVYKLIDKYRRQTLGELIGHNR